MKPSYLSVEQVLFIHYYVIETTGGAHGVRNLGGMESALARPQQGYGDRELFPDIYAKVAALMEGINRNHPFIDGNKRTAIAAASTLLALNGWTLTASNAELLAFSWYVADEQPEFSAIHEWFIQHSQHAG